MPHYGRVSGKPRCSRPTLTSRLPGAQVQFTDHGVAIPINGTQVCVANYKENRHYSRPLSEGLPTDRVVVVGLTDRDCIPKYVFDLPVKECILRDLGKPIMLCPDSAAAQIIYGPVKYGPADLKRKLDALWESGRPIEATPGESFRVRLKPVQFFFNSLFVCRVRLCIEIGRASCRERVS